MSEPSVDQLRQERDALLRQRDELLNERDAALKAAPGIADELRKERDELRKDRETAVSALREIATKTEWPARYGGPALAMAARAQQALQELHT